MLAKWGAYKFAYFSIKHDDEARVLKSRQQVSRVGKFSVLQLYANYWLDCQLCRFCIEPEVGVSVVGA